MRIHELMAGYWILWVPPNGSCMSVYKRREWQEKRLRGANPAAFVPELHKGRADIRSQEIMNGAQRGSLSASSRPIPALRLQEAEDYRNLT